MQSLGLGIFAILAVWVVYNVYSDIKTRRYKVWFTPLGYILAPLIRSKYDRD